MLWQGIRKKVQARERSGCRKEEELERMASHEGRISHVFPELSKRGRVEMACLVRVRKGR